MEELLLCQAAVTEPKDRQVSCVCTYYIMTRGETEVSHLTLLQLLLLPLGRPKRKKRGYYFTKTLQ